MDYSHYEASAKTVVNLTNDITEKKAEWIRRILFLGATLFGILISLYGETQATLYIRLCFAAACISLALGLTTLSVASYHHIVILSHVRNALSEEVQNAIDNDRPVSFVRTDKVKFFVICETCAYIFLLLSILLLAIYVLLFAILGS